MNVPTLDASLNARGALPDPPKPGEARRLGEYVDTGRQGLVRRFLATSRHLVGLTVGAAAAWLRKLPAEERRRWRIVLLRAMATVAVLFVDRKLRRESFPVQLRRRLERLGPTYIKLGQVLALREDLLPRAVTDELRHLLEGLPAVSYERFLEQVAASLRRPVTEVFLHIRSTPLGSASIGQAHLATTRAGEQVILKIVKPGVVATLRRDTVLLRWLGHLLQAVAPHFQPRRVIDEFCRSTMQEVDLVREADNAERFAASFEDRDEIVFPRIHRELSSPGLLVMEYIDGIQPTDPRARALRDKDRERLVELGAEAILRMLYRDGFFHADLHPGNLRILPGPRLAFLDLGMVGRFDADLRRRLLYFYYSLVVGDSDSAATYLTELAITAPRGDPASFRRDVEDVCRRWSISSRSPGRRSREISLGRLIFEAMGRAARHRMYFPMEMVLMARAIVTFEAVGHSLVPDFDVARLSRRQLGRIVLERFAPLHLLEESLTALPELTDTLAKMPRLISEGLRLLERSTRRPAEHPFAGLHTTLFGGFCLVAGAILISLGGPWTVSVPLLLLGLLLPRRR